MRVSLHVKNQDSHLLIDSSPDLRQQALAFGITQLDAVIYTHDHADHTHGIDDLRSFNHQKNGPLDAYGSAETLQGLQERFGYAFKPAMPDYGWFRPCLVPHVIDTENFTPLRVGSLDVQPFVQRHGRHFSLGVRIGNLAYSTDTNHLPEAAFETLKGVEVWIVDCLRKTPAPTHAHLDMALGWIARVKPRLAILTHMSHDLDYEELSQMLPREVVPGYDGMVIEC